MKISTILNGLEVPETKSPCNHKESIELSRSLIRHVRHNVQRDVELAEALEQQENHINAAYRTALQSGHTRKDFLPRRLEQLADDLRQWEKLVSDDHRRIGNMVVRCLRYLTTQGLDHSEILMEAGVDLDEFSQTRSTSQETESADDSVVTTIYSLSNTRNLTWSQTMEKHPVEYLIQMSDRKSRTEMTID